MFKALFALTLALCTAWPAMAATRSSVLADQYLLNQGTPNALNRTRLGDKVIADSIRRLQAYWDFSVQGGTAGTITLKNVLTNKDAVLPKGAIVRDCIFDVITAPSPTPAASFAFGTGQSISDLKVQTAATAYTGLVACIPTGSVATSIKLTADRTMSMTLSGANVTAGKVYVDIEYVLSNTQ